MAPHTGVRPATRDDLPRLGVVAPAIYGETYSRYWEDPAAYVRHLASFSEAAFAAHLEQPSLGLWVAEVEQAVVGFLLLARDSPEPVQKRAGGYELRRIYLLRQVQGMGFGRRLMEAAQAEAVAHGAAYLWLDVMLSATWARQAYARWGFREVGELRFEGGIRADEAGMAVLVKDLPAAC